MKTIGFITAEDDFRLTEDDRLTADPLRTYGYDLTPVVWETAKAEDLAGLDALVFRSCWNYHRKTEEFFAWLDTLESLSMPIFNPLPVLRWNAHKSYLNELAGVGIPVPQTLLVPRGQVFENVGTISSDRVVVKPAISANGHDTFLIDAMDEIRLSQTVNALAVNRDVLLQEYMPEIETEGEVSLIFFNGRFSHALRKLPLAGEFRIHAEYGGRRLPFSPSPATIDQGQAVLAGSVPDLLYARVDTVERNGRLFLMELEALDPFLYMGYAEGSAQRFADAIAEKLGDI